MLICLKKIICLSIFVILSMVYTTNAQQSLDEYLYRFYITAGIYLGYSSGAAVGIGPKFSIGFKTYGYNRGDINVDYFIANNITAGYIRHFGTKHAGKEFLFEFQTVYMRFTDFMVPDYCVGAGTGISLFRYNLCEDSTAFYIRPRISAFAGNCLFLNVSKTFGLPKVERYTGLHIGGTAVVGFPFWFLLWD